MFLYVPVSWSVTTNLKIMKLELQHTTEPAACMAGAKNPNMLLSPKQATGQVIDVNRFPASYFSR
jgi:hypothetical protein